MIAGILLAAGASTRMRGRDKLLEDVDGNPLLSHVISVLEASRLDSLHIVLPPQAEAPKRHALLGARIPVIAADCATGMAASLRAGLSSLPQEVDGAMVVLADMPAVQATHVNRLIDRFQPHSIVRSVTPDGRPGHPVLFARRYFDSLMALKGDVGAKEIVRGAQGHVIDVVTTDEAATLDLDTPEDWAKWRSG